MVGHFQTILIVDEASFFGSYVPYLYLKVLQLAIVGYLYVEIGFDLSQQCFLLLLEACFVHALQDPVGTVDASG